MSNDNNSIPVITVHEKIVDVDRRPTQTMSVYFHTVLKAILSKIEDAPSDGKLYGRKDGEWIEIVETV